MVRAILLAAAALGATTASARPFMAWWAYNQPGADGVSCVATCAREGGQPVAAGGIAYPSSGDPALYVCRAFAPGQEIFGERAGYNWNGWIGANVQPGCTVVGGGPNGYSHVRNFWCLCEETLPPFEGDQ